MKPKAPQSEGRKKQTQTWIAKHYRQQNCRDSGIPSTPLASDTRKEYARWDWTPRAPPPAVGPVGVVGAQGRDGGENPFLEPLPSFWSLWGAGEQEKAQWALGESRGDLPRIWPEGKEDTTERSALVTEGQNEEGPSKDTNSVGTTSCNSFVGRERAGESPSEHGLATGGVVPDMVHVRASGQTDEETLWKNPRVERIRAEAWETMLKQTLEEIAVKAQTR